MNILFCGDDGVCKGIFMSSLSLTKHTKKALNIYILTAKVEGRRPITQDFAKKLEDALSSKGIAHKVILLDISDRFNGYLPLANMGTRFTPLCMLRLFADVTPDIPDKILYLDADVLCRGDFEAFYETDLKGVEIAGVPDRYGKWFFGNIFKHDYFNSGVLLMNLEKIRESGLFGKCRTLCREKKMFMPDQSALNSTAIKLKVPAKYNEQGKIKKDTVFKHFTTYFEFFPYFRAVTVKPWNVEKLHKKLKIFEFDDIINQCKEYIK